MSNKTFAIRPFEKLRKKIERKTPVPATEPVRQEKKDHPTEQELFSHAMDEVLEIEAFRSLSCVHHPKKTALRTGNADPDREVRGILAEIADGRRPIHLPDTQEYVEWMNPEYDDDLISKLTAGHIAIEGFIDLHGCTVPEAEEELDQFLKESSKKSLSCIKIIHGRGLRSTKGARIKNAVVKRLSGRYRRNIIAFVTARQCDGGLGALYVLLGKK